MSRDVLITPLSGLIDFKNTTVSRAQIALDVDNNLVISNSDGDLTIGNVATDVFIGDGVNSVDIVFEQNGSIRGLAGKTLTLGSNGSSLAFATNFTSTGFANISSTLASGNTTVTGFINVSSTGQFGGNLTITGTTNTSVALNVGANVNLGTARINVGNSTVNTFITSGTVTTDGTIDVLGASTLRNTLAAGNTIITGFINVSSTGRLLSIGVGTAASATTGEIRATNNITAFFSDKRLKTGITPITNALKKLCGITGVTFQSNDTAAKYGYTDRKVQVGVIAQEVKEVLPQVVVAAPFDIGRNEDGSEYSISGENYLTVQYEKLIPLLVEAIKELKEEIDRLKQT